MKRLTGYRANSIFYNYLKSNDIQGRVALPVNICGSVVDTLRLAGLECMFVDISANTLCLNKDMVLEMVKDCSVLIFVHTYGVEIDAVDFFKQVRKINPNIIIVDDKCLCLPEFSVDNSYADLVLYSTGGKKQVNLGEGAIGFVADKWKYDEVVVPNGNGVLENRCYTLNEQALLTKMDSIIAHKEKLNDIYRRLLPKQIQFPERFQHWRFNIWVEQPQVVLDALLKEGLFASNHYQPHSTDCPVAIELHRHVVNLFNDFYYTEQQAVKTCEIINQLL